MSKAKTARKRTFSFEGTKVIVAAAIFNKWDKFPVEKKLAFNDAAYERQISNLRTEAEKGVEELWQRERANSERLEAVRKISLFSPEKSASGNVIWTLDPGKLRNAAETHVRVAKALSALADFIERPPDIRAFTELRRILVSNWVPPEGVCLCWMSYRALEKFLRLTCPGIDVHSVAALEKECRRLELPKMDYPLVKQDRVYRDGNTVHIAGSSYRPAVNR
jgi:hypothetical protein